jgi:MOSC domain-containing protein YiiM
MRSVAPCYTFKIMDKSSTLKGLIRNLFIKASHGEPMQPVESVEAVAGKGLKGDEAYGRRSRQVLIVDIDRLQDLNLHPGDLRENLTVHGIEIDKLVPGTRLQAGDVILKIVGLCDPCVKLEDLRPGLMEASVGMRGMLAVVESNGTLKEGSPIAVMGQASDELAG